MRIRDYTSADLDALRRMHAAQSFGYPFPNLDSPLFIAKLVLEAGDSEELPAASEHDRSGSAFSSTDFSLWGFAARGQAPTSGSSAPTDASACEVLTENPETEVCATGHGPRLQTRVKHPNQGREELAPGSRTISRESGFTLRRHSGQASHESRVANHESRIVMAVLLRLTAETYLLHDPQAGTPRQRWQHLLALHEAARRTAIACGLDDVQAFLPPRIARAFGRRLARLGWTQDPWPCFSRRVW